MKFGKLKSVDRLAFDGLDNLKNLYIECEIKNIHPNTFSSLTKLENLSLSYNICIDEEDRKGFKMSDVQDSIAEKCSYDANYKP